MVRKIASVGGWLWQTEESGTGPGAPVSGSSSSSSSERQHRPPTSWSPRQGSSSRLGQQQPYEQQREQPTKAYALNTSSLTAPSEMFALGSNDHKERQVSV